MASVEPIQDDDLPTEAEPKGDVTAIRAELESRCAAAKIPVEENDTFASDLKSLRVGIPCGRDRRWVYCWEYGDYQRLLSVSFEKYVFLQGLDAVCNYSTGTIEAAVRALGVPSSRLLISRLFKIPLADTPEPEQVPPLELPSPTPDSKTSLIIGPPSVDLSTLVRGPKPRLSLTIRCEGVAQHDRALELARRASDALFFQIDLLHEIALTLVRERRPPSRRRRPMRPDQAAEIGFPNYEYDSAPISLYWYARSAAGMPLLQYLAYYQVIEYYFPTYSQADARRKLKAVLKDPAFRGDRDADLGRLLSAIHVSRSGAFGDERSQLRATILECTDAEALRQFILADPARAEFLSSKAKGLCEQKIPVANTTADLRSDVAERIYEIRCKIVHTKTDAKNAEFELLLPFSKEAEQLSHDIDLVQFIAQQVLIAASIPFRT